MGWQEEDPEVDSRSCCWLMLEAVVRIVQEWRAGRRIDPEVGRTTAVRKRCAEAGEVTTTEARQERRVGTWAIEVGRVPTWVAPTRNNAPARAGRVHSTTWDGKGMAIARGSQAVLPCQVAPIARNTWADSYRKQIRDAERVQHRQMEVVGLPGNVCTHIRPKSWVGRVTSLVEAERRIANLGAGMWGRDQVLAASGTARCDAAAQRRSSAPRQSRLACVDPC